MKVVNPYRFSSGGGGSPGTKSCQFDGASGERIAFTDNNNLSFGDSVTDVPFSITAWCYVTAAETWFRCAIINKGFEYYFGCLYGNDKPSVWLMDNGTGNRIGRRATNAAATDQWVLLSMTYDGSSTNGGIKIYEDTTQVDTNDYGGGSYVAMHNSTANMHMGYWPESTTYRFHGNIADPIMWDIELSSAQIADIFNGGVPRTETAESLSGNIISNWVFDDGGPDPNDQTSTNDGTGILIDASNIVLEYP